MALASRRSLLRAGWIFLVLSLIAPNLHAAKVLRFASPFGTTPIWLCGGPFGFAPGGDSSTIMKPTPDNWVEYVLPEGAATDKYSFVVMPDWQYQQSTPDLTRIFQTSDTAWILPEPAPNGPLKAFGTRPKTKIVMLWNPWEAPSPARKPYIQFEGRAWGAMAPIARLPGWYTASITGYNSLSVLFSDSAKTSYFTADGVQPAAGTAMVLDSVAAKSDTVWVRARPEPVGTPFASATRPSPKVAMVFNPWRSRKPLTQPRLTIGTLGPVAMSPSLEYCGWYAFEFYERPGSALISSSRGTQTVGAAGFDDPTNFDIATLLAKQDTAWIMTDSVTGKPSVNARWMGEKGLCEIVLLASTIHDFPSGSPANRQFGRGKGCGQGGWSVVNGMVESDLGPDRKPVRSAYDTGWNGIPNSWGGTEFGFRCEFDTAAIPEVGDSGISTEWFRNVPGRNAETCRDIPLRLDSVNGTYGYENKQFFPIDDFDRLADGSPNPYFDQIRGEDQKMHNYAFCLESHGEFEYKKGQSYDFTGDDDVWFFVNNRLVVDLGGIHPASSQRVLLDTIGRVITKRTVDWKDFYDTTWNANRMVEGKTYTWDFFFCERSPAGSSMKMTTSMNMRTDAGFQVKATSTGPGTTDYDLFMSTTKGQGCQATASVIRATGSILLSGGQFPAPRRLSSGIWYGGIRVDSANGSVKLDSAAMAGLAPGHYVLKIVASFDSTSYKEYPFTVPFSAGPRFTAKSAYSAPKGSVLQVSVGSFNKLGADSSEIRFVPHPVAGLKFFRDSALTSEIVAGDTLHTGANTVARRFWVQGVVAGTYALAIGSTGSDTADTYGSIVFQDRTLRFVDAAGIPLAQTPPLSLEVDEPVQVFVRAYVGDSLCRSCDGRILVDGSNPALVFSSTVPGPAAGAFALSQGASSFWLRGTSPAIGASFAATLDFDTAAHATWRPIVIGSRRIRFLDGSGKVVDTLEAIDQRVLSGKTISVQLWNKTAPCTICTGHLRLASADVGIVFRDVAGNAIDSVPVANGNATFAVWGAAPVARGTIALQAPSLWATTTAGPVTFRTVAPDSALVFDTDGDGRADSAAFFLAQPWKTGNMLSLSWPDANSTTPLQSLVPVAFDGDSGVLGLRLAAPFAPDRTSDLGAVALFSWGIGAPALVPVKDRVAPVPVSAEVRWSAILGDPDTLRVKVSESVITSASTANLEWLRGSWIPTRETQAFLDAAGTEIVLLFASASPESVPVPGESVRLSLVADLLGNRPGPTPKSVVVTGLVRPPRNGWYQDTDGDGRIDRAVFRFDSPVRTASMAFDLELPGGGGRTNQVGRVVPTDSLLVAVDLSEPFPFGMTGFVAGEWAGVSGGSKVPMDDSTAPVVDTAFVRLTETYDGSDTLFLVPSERLQGVPATSWYQIRSGSAFPALGGTFIASRGDTQLVLLPADGVGGVRAGDSIRFVPGFVRDLPGNIPGSDAIWRRVGGGIRPPFVRIQPPRGFVQRPLPELDPVTAGGLEIQAVDGSDWKNWSPETGYRNTSACDTTTCTGPGIELNTPVRIFVAVFDRMGVHVDTRTIDITESVLSGLRTDRLGRTKVRFLWNGSTMDGRPVASGIYLFRVVVQSRTTQTGTKLSNQVWKVGLKRVR